MERALPKKALETRKPRWRWFGRRPADVPHDQDGWFDGETRQVFALAREEAKRFNHNYVGTEHLLLGLIREEGSTAGRVLVSLDVQ